MNKWLKLIRVELLLFFKGVCIYIHSGTLKVAPEEGKKIQSRNFVDKKKNMWYAKDPSLVTMRMTVHPVEALQSGRERDINQC